MKPVKILGIIVAIIVLGIMTWPPWLSNEEAIEIIRRDEKFLKDHAGLDLMDEIEINIYHIPFGRYAATIESAYFTSC